MARKNCKMTAEERAKHDKATKLRKMTDDQLCDFVTEQYNIGMSEGMKLVKSQQPKPQDEAEIIEKFIGYLEKGTGNGIGGGAIYRLRKELKKAVEDGIIRGGAA